MHTMKPDAQTHYRALIGEVCAFRAFAPIFGARRTLAYTKESLERLAEILSDYDVEVAEIETIADFFTEERITPLMLAAVLVREIGATVAHVRRVAQYDGVHAHPGIMRHVRRINATRKSAIRREAERMVRYAEILFDGRNMLDSRADQIRDLIASTAHDLLKIASDAGIRPEKVKEWRTRISKALGR